MNTQNTPVHISLWHKGFWLLSIANLLVTMSVYALIPVMPQWLMENEHFSSFYTGLSMGAFALGVFSFGFFCSYLVQRYRRNLVCIASILIMGLLIAGLFYLHDNRITVIDVWFIIAQRFLLGAAFGLAKMVLSSTLIVDTSESFQRTEANHSSSWFARFAISLGPLFAIISNTLFGFGSVVLMSIAFCVVSVLLIRLVDFPFRAPEDRVNLFSLDRFFLPHGFPLFLNLLPITIAVGLVMTVERDYTFYGMIMAGFFLALLSGRFVFPNAELKSEVVTGLVLFFAALLLMITRHQMIVSYAAPTMIGLGIGIIGARFLLFFIKLSRHCQRGTSQSTYILGWESGVALGVGVGYAMFAADGQPVLLTALVLVTFALVLYILFTHNWFLKNKNR
ncbi:MAG: MFS transporter [Prevotella sp.]|nr:MFS transporter [Prevotella sp.]